MNLTCSTPLKLYGNQYLFTVHPYYHQSQENCGKSSFFLFVGLFHELRSRNNTIKNVTHGESHGCNDTHKSLSRQLQTTNIGSHTRHQQCWNVTHRQPHQAPTVLKRHTSAATPGANSAETSHIGKSKLTRDTWYFSFNELLLHKKNF